MKEKFIAKVSISIRSDIALVWDALVNPKLIKEYMFGTDVVSNWNVGDTIVWKGVWQGKTYEDKGKILALTPNKELKVTHFSPLSGGADLPENYHTLKYSLDQKGDQTVMTLTQNGNRSQDELEHSEKMWGSMLTSIKVLLEK